MTIFRVTDLKQYFYCPRVVYYAYCLPQVRPVTAKMEAGIEAQVEAEERYRNLIEQAPTPFVIHHGEYFEYANPAAVALYGAESADELTGRKLSDFVHEDDSPGFAERMKTIIEEGRTTEPVEQKRLKLDGSEIIVIARGVPIMWEGEPAALGALIDVTTAFAPNGAIGN